MVADSAARVEIVQPTEGGMRRTTVQPGSVFGFESVDLYAMVSGYLKTRRSTSALGSRRARSWPRSTSAGGEGARRGGRAGRTGEGARRQAEARIKTMEGERDAAAAAVEAGRIGHRSARRRHELAEKQLARVQGPGRRTRGR